MRCWRCGETFEAQEDHLPFFFHKCPDGVLTANKNLSFNRHTERQWINNYQKTHTGRRNIGDYARH